MTGTWILRTDGGSRGNPGPAAAAFVLQDPAGERACSGGRFIGEATNNIAEYEALIWGLECALLKGARSLRVFLDSELVVKQIHGTYKVKHPNMLPLYQRVCALLRDFESTEVTHVRREENREADRLANEAMDVRGEVGDAPTAAETGAQESLFEQPTPAVSGPVERRGVYELTVRSHFDAAHALRDYPGECRRLHGHTWDVEVTVAGEQLDEIEIVYDFKRLKADLAAVIDRFDHAFLNEIPPFDTISPTAENLARVIYDELDRVVDRIVSVVEVAVWESPIARIVYRRV